MLCAWHRAPADELVQQMTDHYKVRRHDGVVDVVLLAALDSDLVRKSRRGGPKRGARERRSGDEAARRPHKRAQDTIASESVYSSSGYAAVSTNLTDTSRS